MQKKLELMYRPPGSDEYKDITKVLDEILLRLESIEFDLKTLKNKENH